MQFASFASVRVAFLSNVWSNPALTLLDERIENPRQKCKLILESGNARLTSDGVLKIHVKGLVLNDTTLPADVNGTPDGVCEVVATLVCWGRGAAGLPPSPDECH